MLLGKRSAVGIHVTDHILEIVQISVQKGRFFVDGAVKRTLPKGVVEQGVLVSPEELKTIIEEAMRNALPRPIKPKNVVFAIPDSLIYVHTLHAPVDEKDFTGHVARALAENVPLATEDALYVTQKLITSGVNADVLLIAMSRSAIAPWRAFFAELDIPLRCFDVEALALYRGLMMHRKTEVIAVVDIGARRTDISIFDGAGLRTSRQVSTAGEDITTSIAVSLGMSVNEAEDRKKKEGVKESGSPIFIAAVKALEPVGKEIRGALDDFYEKYQRRVASVVLVGGTSQLPGLKEYMQVTSDVPVSIGVPVLAVEGAHHEDEYPVFAKNIGVAAVGLARRALDRGWEGDPCFSAEYEGAPSKRQTVSLSGVAQGAKKSVHMMSIFPRAFNQFRLLIFGLFCIVGLGALTALSFKDTVERFRAGDTDVFVPNVEYITLMPAGEENENQVGTTTGSALPTTPSASEMVKILQTPTGWLNVRSGPGTTYAQVTRVNPGESYPLLEEKGDWYHIRIGQQEGWIARQYAERLSN
ncbi:MAG: pilus assembly protein PilM [Patescibacteria group bacterium]